MTDICSNSKIKYILVNIEDPDNAHIFRFVDCATGKMVSARISGGESNISAIMYDWDSENTSWSRSFYFYTLKMNRRDFNNLWKSLPYGGCERKEVQNYIRQELAQN